MKVEFSPIVGGVDGTVPTDDEEVDVIGGSRQARNRLSRRHGEVVREIRVTQPKPLVEPRTVAGVAKGSLGTSRDTTTFRLDEHRSIRQDSAGGLVRISPVTVIESGA